MAKKKIDPIVAYRWQCRTCSTVFSTPPTSAVLESAPIPDACPDCGAQSTYLVEYGEGTPPIVDTPWFYRLPGDKRKKKK